MENIYTIQRHRFWKYSQLPFTPYESTPIHHALSYQKSGQSKNKWDIFLISCLLRPNPRFTALTMLFTWPGHGGRSSPSLAASITQTQRHNALLIHRYLHGQCCEEIHSFIPPVQNSTAKNVLAIPKGLN